VSDDDVPMGGLAAQDSYDPFAAEQFVNPVVAGAVSNAMAPQQPDNSQVLFNTASPLVNITQGDIDSGIGLGMSFSGGGLGIKAYHGSPHDFDAFDLSKIGTGEGAQAYGHGLYFAESEPTARFYRDNLSDLKPRALEGNPDLTLPSWVAKTVESRNPVAINDMRTDFQGRLADMKRQLADPNVMQPWNIEANIPGIENILKALDHVEAGAKLTPPGRMYEVNINADPSQFLDWDKPLSQQSEQVRSLLQQSAPPQGLAHTGTGNAEVLGGLGQGPSAVDQANRFAGVPSGRVVSQRMGSVVDNSKVGNPVVGLNPVDVVDVLGGQQGAAKMSGHDASMLLSKLPVHGGNNVSLGVGRAGSPKGSVASGAAEGFGVHGDVIGMSAKGFPALSADEIKHMTVPQLLERLGSRDAASNALREQGVAGIKYLDQGSRGAGTGSSNYVVFNPSIIDIMKKYGLAGAAPAGMGALAAQDAYQQQGEQ
jgi:hypothetical protein